MENYNQIFDGMTVQKIEDTIGYRFENRGLLVQAFTRSSFHNEHPAYPDNEVLELIGDSVLSLSVLTYFKNTYTKLGERGLLTDWNEGKLSALKNDLVNKKQLAARMEQLGLHRYLLLSRGDAVEGIAQEDSVREDLFESILGAVYVDSGMCFERVFDVAQTMLDMRLLVKKSAERVHISYRNDLQEWCQHKKRRFQTPAYAEKQFADDDFLSTVTIPEIGMEAQGRGKNIKYARESAAKALLERLEKYGEDAFFADEVKQENFVGRLQEKLQALGDGSVAVYDPDAADELLANGEHLFTVSCQCLGRCTYGKGSSKKAAKQKAAEEMLKKLAENSKNDSFAEENKLEMLPDAEEFTPNYKGQLKELFDGTGKEVVYDTVSEEPKPFSAHLIKSSCKVGEHCTYGKGSSKKAAEQNAAEEMLKFLKFK